MITNKMPDLSNLMTFGCPTYAHIDQSRMRKFEDKAFIGIFVGYAFNSLLTWLIYNTATQRVTRIRNITFDEEWKSTTYISSPPSSTTTTNTPRSRSKLYFLHESRNQ